MWAIFSSMRFRYLIVAAIGLVVGLLILVLWKTPRITAWLPDTNEIRANQSITFTSNTPLLEESLGSRFQISPFVSGDIRIEERSIHFDPFEPWEYGKFYTEYPWRVIWIQDGDNIEAEMTPRKEE